jgi:cytochrome c-type biogenesis protein CcmE
MFEQIDDPEVTGRKTWKERLTEGAIILAVVAVVLGIILYALHVG